MRPIIFRGKLKDKEQADFFNDWFYGDLIHCNDGSICIRQQETGQELEVIPETVGQYTGRNDKNGVDIFEGGIVTYSGAAGIVFYDKDSSMFMVSFQLHRSRYSFDSLDEEVEVIGNIHDNKNLING